MKSENQRILFCREPRTDCLSKITTSGLTPERVTSAHRARGQLRGMRSSNARAHTRTAQRGCGRIRNGNADTRRPRITRISRIQSEDRMIQRLLGPVIEDVVGRYPEDSSPSCKTRVSGGLDAIAPSLPIEGGPTGCVARGREPWGPKRKKYQWIRLTGSHWLSFPEKVERVRKPRSPLVLQQVPPANGFDRRLTTQPAIPRR